MRYVVVFLLLFVFIGCASKEVYITKVEAESFETEIKDFSEGNISEDIEIYDLINIPQDVSYYVENIASSDAIYEIQKKYEEYYFSVWNDTKPRESLNSIKWPFYSYKVGESYGENLQLLEEVFFDKIYDNANFEAFSTINKNAITLEHTNIRAYPTIRPLLKDPTIAGEGFPFDYLQNSSVQANKPLFVSHYSKDGEWAYIFTSFTSGWIKSNEMVFLDKKHTDIWQKAQQIFLTKEDVSLYSTEGDFLFKSKIGMMLALVEENITDYTALAISVYKNSEPYFVRLKIPKEIASKEVLRLNSDNLKHIISEVSISNYGWGGMYGQRDCSSTLRDLFAPFGIWLPRNSSMQSRVGKVIELDALSDAGKIKVIKEKAIPFQTLLYKQGHIVLYVGTYNDEIVVFHNAWGIKTKKDGVEGRVIVGKSIFSTLKLGKNQKDYDEEAEILRNLKSMNILTL